MLRPSIFFTDLFWSGARWATTSFGIFNATLRYVGPAGPGRKERKALWSRSHAERREKHSTPGKICLGYKDAAFSGLSSSKVGWLGRWCWADEMRYARHNKGSRPPPSLFDTEIL